MKDNYADFFDNKVKEYLNRLNAEKMNLKS